MTKCHLPLDTLQCLSFQSHPPLCLRDYRTGLTVKNSSYVQSWHLRTRGDGSVLLWLLIQWRLSATLQNIGIMFESQGVQRRGCHFFCLFTVEVIYLDFHVLLVLHSVYNLTEQAHAMWNRIANWWWCSNMLKLATQNKVTILFVFWG